MSVCCIVPLCVVCTLCSQKEPEQIYLSYWAECKPVTYSANHLCVSRRLHASPSTEVIPILLYYSLLPVITPKNTGFGDTNKGGWRLPFMLVSRRSLRGKEMQRLHLSKDKNSLRPPPRNLLSGCHGSNEGGERGSSRDCKWESTPLLFLSVSSTPVHLSVFLSS